MSYNYVRFKKHFQVLALVPLLAATAQSCASMQRQLEVTSQPAGAEVFNRAGEKIGVTPLVLQDSALDKVLDDGRAYVQLRAPGYAAERLLLEFKGRDSHDIRLLKLDDSYFSEKVMADFMPQTNRMIRELLSIQGLIVVRKLDQAEKSLNEFQKQFPQVAASYVMHANIALMTGRKKEAKAYLLRARSIDPADSVVSRMIQGLEE